MWRELVIIAGWVGDSCVYSFVISNIVDKKYTICMMPISVLDKISPECNGGRTKNMCYKNVLVNLIFLF